MDYPFTPLTPAREQDIRESHPKLFASRKRFVIMLVAGLLSATLFFLIVIKPQLFAMLIKDGFGALAWNKSPRFTGSDRPIPVSAPITGPLPVTLTPTPTGVISPTGTRRNLELNLSATIFVNAAMVADWPDATTVRYDCQDLLGHSSSDVVSLYVRQPLTISVPVVGTDTFECTFDVLEPQTPEGYTWLPTRIDSYNDGITRKMVFINERLVGLDGAVYPTVPPVPTSIAPSSTPTPLPPSPSPTLTPMAAKRVFVSSASYNGNIGGLTGADARCQSLATAAVLGGKWKAWLSDGSVSATSRLTHYNGPYKRLDGKIVASSWDDLTDGELMYGIYVSEKKTNINKLVWTNTNIIGNSKSSSTTTTCGNWRDATTTVTARAGATYLVENGWTDSNSPSCASQAHLYCVEQ